MNCKSGIYAIVNIKNNNLYIGSAVNIEQRWWQHRSDLRTKVHRNKHLQHSWNKYGEEIFVFLRIEECEKESLIQREQYYIDTMNPEYNILRVANSQLGLKRSAESCKKMSDSKKGKPSNFKGNPSPMKGKHHSEKTRIKMSLSHTGVPHPFKIKKRAEKINNDM